MHISEGDKYFDFSLQSASFFVVIANCTNVS